MTNEALATMITIDFAVLVVLVVLCTFELIRFVLQQANLILNALKVKMEGE